MYKFGKFLIGVFCGALVGGGVALLLTPLKGSAMRERLQSSYAHMQGEVKKAASERVRELNEQLARLQNKNAE
mgnify:CR=1 FL=1|jgi:gas vesicle protein